MNESSVFYVDGITTNHLDTSSETTPNPLKRLTRKSGPGIHRPSDNPWDLPVPRIYLSELVRDFQNFVCPGPVRDFQISGSCSGLVKILLALRPDWTEPLGPGPIGFGPWIPGQLEDRANSNEFSFMILECP